VGSSATALLALGDLGSAVAPTFAVLAAAQVLIGAAVAGVVAAGTAAVGVWAGEGERTRVLSWALIGQPTAWIVGMPLAGVLGEHSWRLGWLVLPLGSAVLATMVLLAMPKASEQRSASTRLRPVLADRAIARWALAELLFNCGWSGMLVYAGALFAESYDAPSSVVGLILGGGAGVYVCGNLAARRLAARQPHRQLVALALLLVVLVTAFDGVRLGTWASAALFGLTALVGGARTLVGSAVGLSVAPETRLAAMGLRTAAVQIGSVAGTGVAGLALAAGGYGALGVTMAALCAGSAAALLELRIGVTRLEPVGARR
jgi:DHA1 family inner membrane transport protein